jgi:hypothetical protein
MRIWPTSQSLPRAIRQSILVYFLLPGGVGHAGLRHFLFDAGEGSLVEFFLGLILSHLYLCCH